MIHIADLLVGKVVIPKEFSIYDIKFFQAGMLCVLEIKFMKFGKT